MKDKKREKRGIFGFEPYIWMMFIGTILIILATISYSKAEFAQFARPILKSLGTSVLVAGILSYVFETRRIKDYFTKRISEVMLDYGYLSEQPHEKLILLRDKIIERIASRDSDDIPRSLIQIDRKVNHLLTDMYYDFFKLNIECSSKSQIKDTEGDSFNYTEKIVRSWYKVVNPNKKKKKFLLSSSLELDNEEIDGKKTLTIKSLSVKTDDHTMIDVSKFAVVSFEPCVDSDFGYKCQTQIKDSRNDKEFEWEFEDSITINMEEIRLVPKKDDVYTKKFLLPVKNCQLQYISDEKDIRLAGSCFSTFSGNFPEDINVVRNNHSISIESKTWLLPGNGMFVAEINA